MSDRIHNFGAGPGVLPEPVLKQAQQDIWNIAGSGMGIAEHSHRGKLFERIISEAEAEVRRLADIPDRCKVLSSQGEATRQVAMVPMNLLPPARTAGYLLTRIPARDEIKYTANPAYVHITSNNTIYGTQWKEEPPVPDGVPLVADTSSDMFSRPIDVTRYGRIYAGAQKNLGPSGIVLVIVREDLTESAPTALPTMLQYRTYVKERSLYNTPPTFAIYMVGQVLKWIRASGGLAAMADRNASKAKILYDFLDQSELFQTSVHPDSRSLMNVCFRLPSQELNHEFVTEATARGLEGLKGHRSAGGMRASLYNACPRASVEVLVAFMKEFEGTHRPPRA